MQFLTVDNVGCVKPRTCRGLQENRVMWRYPGQERQEEINRYPINPEVGEMTVEENPEPKDPGKRN